MKPVRGTSDESGIGESVNGREVCGMWGYARIRDECMGRKKDAKMLSKNFLNGLHRIELEQSDYLPPL
jgi:hypothetical protein